MSLSAVKSGSGSPIRPMPMTCSTTASSGALPVRSPVPSSVPLTTAQPAWIAARQLATTRWVSLCGWNSRSSDATPELPQPADPARHRARRGHAVEGEAEAHRVAHAELRPHLGPVALRRRHDRLGERQHELLGRAGGVLQVEARAQAGVEHGPHRVQVGAGGLAAAARPELVEGVVVARRGEHPGLAHADAAHQVGVAAGRADPGRRLHRGAAAVALERRLQHPAVGRPVDEELGLADGAAARR